MTHLEISKVQHEKRASTTFDAFIGRAMQQTAAGGKTLVGP